MFNSYVKLPEGKCDERRKKRIWGLQRKGSLYVCVTLAGYRPKFCNKLLDIIKLTNLRFGWKSSGQKPFNWSPLQHILSCLVVRVRVFACINLFQPCQRCRQ